MIIKRILSILAAVGFIIPAALGFHAAEAARPLNRAAEMRGVWVATVINLDYPSRPGLSANELRAEADAILDGALALGFNAIFLQVRPTSDALYRSEIFPWSDVLTGTQGEAPPDGFDPLAHFITGAHERGMELHAWLNPFRIARNTHDLSTLHASNPARQNPEWTVAHSDGNLYYDPGIPEVLDLILSGIREILENYPVDGIHFDDYFYPGADFDDLETFRQNRRGFRNIDDWRRDNVNRLIRETRNLVRSIRGRECRFGISPVAIWANAHNNPLGSDTNGYQSFYQQFADSRRWVLRGYVDYVVPQIYWEIGREGSDYEIVLQWWVDLIEGTAVDLYIGHATFLMNGNNPREAWAGVGEIARQTAMNSRFPAVRGSVHFRYALIAEDAAIAAAVRHLHNNAVPVFGNTERIVMPTPQTRRLAVGRPDHNLVFSGTHYYITGSSDPNLPLAINGREVETRTPRGFFSYFAELSPGANNFVFSQGGEAITRIITVPDGTAPEILPDILHSEKIQPGVFPDGFDKIAIPGETIALTAVAPIGAEVFVRLGSDAIQMAPDTESPLSDSVLFATTFRAEYQVPEINSRHSPIISIGRPIYTSTLNGRTSTRSATGFVKVSTESQKLAAEVVSDAAFAFPEASSANGPVGELVRGMVAHVVSQDDFWVGLSSGLFVPKSDVRLTYLNRPLSFGITFADYISGERWDTLNLSTNFRSAALASWDGEVLTLSVFGADNAPAPEFENPAAALIRNVSTQVSGGLAVYTLTPADPASISGFSTESLEGGIRLNIKRKPQAGTGARPLEGFTIVLDPGHGGDDLGALSPFGADFAEAHITLYAALKLRNELSEMGARVVLTRAADTTVSLGERVNIARKAKPDLFISLHCNSMPEDVDSDEIRGVVVLYREEVQRAFSEHIYEYLQSALGIEGRGVRYGNFFVLRGGWSPGALIELGFINNPFDYEFLISNAEQDRMVSAIASGIVEYFR